MLLINGQQRRDFTDKDVFVADAIMARDLSNSYNYRRLCVKSKWRKLRNRKSLTLHFSPMTNKISIKLVIKWQQHCCLIPLHKKTRNRFHTITRQHRITRGFLHDCWWPYRTPPPWTGSSPAGPSFWEDEKTPFVAPRTAFDRSAIRLEVKFATQ